MPITFNNRVKIGEFERGPGIRDQFAGGYTEITRKFSDNLRDHHQSSSAQHVGISQPPQVNVQQITAQQQGAQFVPPLQLPPLQLPPSVYFVPQYPQGLVFK